MTGRARLLPPFIAGALLLATGAACVRFVALGGEDADSRTSIVPTFPAETLAWADTLLSKPLPRYGAEPPLPAHVASPRDPPPKGGDVASDAELEQLEEEFVPEIPVTVRLVNAAAPAPAVESPRTWLVNTLSTTLYASSFGSEVVDRVSVGTYFILQSGNQDDRYYVKRAYDGALGWLPGRGLAPWSYQPTRADIVGRIGDPDPRAYLYWRWPRTARRMDCVIYFESGWNPRALNRTYNAAGLAQFIPQTWKRTPQGKAGFSPYDPYAAIDAFAWMIHGGGSWGEWEVVYVDLC